MYNVVYSSFTQRLLVSTGSFNCYIKKELTFYLFFLFLESEDDLDEEDLALIQENTGIKLKKVCILVTLYSRNVESDVSSNFS